MKLITNINNSKALADAMAEFRRVRALRRLESERLAKLPQGDRDFRALKQIGDDEDHLGWVVAMLLDGMIGEAA